LSIICRSSHIIFLYRYLMRLKEDDEACREALKSGKVLLYHKLSPLLILHIHFYNCIPISLDLEQILEKIGKDKHIVNESFLLGCTDKNEPQFSLEVGHLGRFCCIISFLLYCERLAVAVVTNWLL
uniref:Uncharacterized protein n=1 Tax=Sinocyclocheilus rhinocerous TaxID=307959 RepID=A0A673MAH9_9TELE